MIQQKDNKSVRATISHETDVVKIKDYYEVHGHFPIFRQVLIETRTDCNNHCKFCPHAFNKKTLGIMSWECYKKIIDQLSDINYNGRIALMLSNEPLLEDRMEDMIVYARQKSPRFFLDMTTNGTLLQLIDSTNSSNLVWIILTSMIIEVIGTNILKNVQSILNLSTLHIGTILRYLFKKEERMRFYQTMPVTYRKSLILVTSVFAIIHSARLL